MIWHNKLGGWRFPGGRIEAGETPEAAAERELREETALYASSAEFKLIGIYEQDVPNDGWWRGYYFLLDAIENPRPLMSEPRKAPGMMFHSKEAIFTMYGTAVESQVLRALLEKYPTTSLL